MLRHLLYVILHFPQSAFASQLVDHLILQWTLRVHLTVSNQKHNLGKKRVYAPHRQATISLHSCQVQCTARHITTVWPFRECWSWFSFLTFHACISKSVGGSCSLDRNLYFKTRHQSVSLFGPANIPLTRSVAHTRILERYYQNGTLTLNIVSMI